MGRQTISTAKFRTAAGATSMIERNNECDPFADIYNRYWGADYHAQALPIIERLLLSHLPAGSPVLDVCCGTGQIAAVISQRGFHVTGIDASEQMIRHAKENAPGVELAIADVRDFSLGKTFSGAYSVFESLNHVPSTKELQSAFSCIHRHLVPGGPFVFDLNREDAFLLYWNETNAIVDSDNVCVMQSEYDEVTRAGTCNITTFEFQDVWKRSDFTVRQICHDAQAVSDALYTAGFSDLCLYDAADAGMTGDIAYARTFFVVKA
jgi:SAM-dependent methyltransferase